jgi:hypothetical protein
MHGQGQTVKKMTPGSTDFSKKKRNWVDNWSMRLQLTSLEHIRLGRTSITLDSWDVTAQETEGEKISRTRPKPCACPNLLFFVWIQRGQSELRSRHAQANTLLIGSIWEGEERKKVLGPVLSEWALVEAADRADFKSSRAAATRRQWGAAAAVSEGISERRRKQGSREKAEWDWQAGPQESSFSHFFQYGFPFLAREKYLGRLENLEQNLGDRMKYLG